MLSFLLGAAGIFIIVAAMYLFGKLFHIGFIDDSFLRGGLGGGSCVMIVNLILRIKTGFETPLNELPEFK